MERINLGLNSPRGLGLLQPKLEMLENVDHHENVFHSPARTLTVSQLTTPKRGESMSSSSSTVKAFHGSAFTPTNENQTVTNLQAMTPVTPLFSDFSTPKSDLERSSFWLDQSLTPETPGRKIAPERTLLSDRLSKSSPFCLTPERQPLDFMSPDRNKNQDSGRRGRPRADMVNNLIIEGAQSGNPIKCKFCERDFPREKSLQAHIRTHTGERPYTCDYPNCTRAFVQSGQLKTHQRLHAGEKPFKCPVDGCTNRYTHANRTCPDHPGVKPQRTTELILQPVISAAEDQEAVYAWLEKYRRDREEKTPGKFGDMLEEETAVTPKRTHEEGSSSKLKTKRGLANEMEEAYGQENIPSPPRPNINRSDILHQALLRAEERSRGLEMERGPVPTFRPFLDPVSPAKSMRRSLEESSPLRGIRRTLGEITPSKNCKVDNTANLDFDLPFAFDLPQIPQPLPLTPLPAEKLFSPVKTSPPAAIVGSPALKLKKRFQERFQEEKQQEDVLAKPISWHEEDVLTATKSESIPSTPLRRERNNSPSTFLVAAALMELHESPTRISPSSAQNQDTPLNLTKKQLD